MIQLNFDGICSRQPTYYYKLNDIDANVIFSYTGQDLRFKDCFVYMGGFYDLFYFNSVVINSLPDADKEEFLKFINDLKVLRDNKPNVNDYLKQAEKIKPLPVNVDTIVSANSFMEDYQPLDYTFKEVSKREQTEQYINNEGFKEFIKFKIIFNVINKIFDINDKIVRFQIKNIQKTIDKKIKNKIEYSHKSLMLRNKICDLFITSKGEK